MKVNAGMLGKATNAVAVRTVDPDGTAVMADENLVDQFAAFWLDDDLLLHDRFLQETSGYPACDPASGSIVVDSNVVGFLGSFCHHFISHIWE